MHCSVNCNWIVFIFSAQEYLHFAMALSFIYDYGQERMIVRGGGRASNSN